jgi:hypothetical protein
MTTGFNNTKLELYLTGIIQRSIMKTPPISSDFILLILITFKSTVNNWIRIEVRNIFLYVILDDSMNLFQINRFFRHLLI